MKIDLVGTVALVTGAARGIGKAIADTLADNGATVVYTDIDFEVVRRSAARSPSSCARQMDVAQEAEVEGVVSELLDRYGRLDILINNAGINTMNHRVSIDQFPLAEWDRILRVDLIGLFLVSRAAARPMIRQKAGRIVNISSVVGSVPLRLQCAFTAAKAGVSNLTKAMALELGPHGVLVNAIAPGSVITENTKRLFYEKTARFSSHRESLLEHIPLGRRGEAREIAYAALFLAAPENSYINGHVLTVDGGWSAGYMPECEGQFMELA